MIDSFFKFKERNTDLRTEIIAGITTFLTMSYIIVVNPMILKNAGMSFDSVLFATVLVSAVSSILMGVYANLPYALAPGMGINAFFTYSMVKGMGISPETALGAVFISGIIFIVFSITKIREKVLCAIPLCLRYAVASGIGVFIALIGLSEVGFIKAGSPLIGFGGFNVETVLFLVGLIVVSILVVKDVKGAFFFSIVLNSLIAVLVSYVGVKFGWLSSSVVNFPEKVVSYPSMDLFLKMDVIGALKWGMIAPIFTLLFTDMFDSISTFLGVAYASRLVDEDGRPLNLDRALLVDAVATTLSGIFGTSSATTYIESAAGIKEGGRTGFSSVVTGLLFLPFAFLSPLLGFIPSVAVAPVLVMVGVFMVQTLGEINWKKMDEAIPSFIAFILIPFTYSITQGIIWGIIAYTFIKILTGRFADVNSFLILINVFSIIALFLMGGR